MIVIQPKTVSEKLLYSTVRIIGEIGTGTGFFFKYKLNHSKELLFILTNKHVVDGNNKLHFKFHESQENSGVREVSNQSFDLIIEVNNSIWIPHPEQDIDLGAILFAPIQEHAKNIMQKDIYGVFLDDSLIKDDTCLQLESDVSDDILMIGYPIGLWDEVNNFPIVRKGIVASHPALNFMGKSFGVVDIACFPGSSGSPILIRMNGYQDKSGNYNIGASKIILLGLLSSGPVYKATGQIEVKEIPTGSVSVVSTDQMIHLGYYVKAREILRLCQYIKKKINLKTGKFKKAIVDR